MASNSLLMVNLLRNHMVKASEFSNSITSIGAVMRYDFERLNVPRLKFFKINGTKATSTEIIAPQSPMKILIVFDCILAAASPSPKENQYIKGMPSINRNPQIKQEIKSTIVKMTNEYFRVKYLFHYSMSFDFQQRAMLTFIGGYL